MFGRLTVSALALTGVAYAESPSTAPATSCGVEPTCTLAPLPGSADRSVYDAAFFENFHPQTALDMVNQTPGVSLNGGEDRRGFAGAVGNLLIDGERPVAKSQSVSNILSQIPASQVVRVEVLRGAAVAGDASGQAVLINVVRTPNAGSGVWDIGAELNRQLGPQGDASWSGRSGSFEYGLGASYYSQYRSMPGRRWLFDDTGALDRYIQSPLLRGMEIATLNGNFAMPLFGGRLAVTAQAEDFQNDSDTFLNAFDAPGGTPLDSIHSRVGEKQRTYETGANFDRDFGPWSLAVVGLLTRKDYTNTEADTDFAGPTFLSSANLEQELDSGESILRATLARDFGTQHHLEFGAEGAINTLDARFTFIEDTGAGATEIFLPNSNVNVEERRAEVFGSYTWRPSNRWSVETRLAEETSTLTFTGDTNHTVDLSYLKPSVQVSRSFGENTQLRLRAYRDVGQLNFYDFVSAASVTDNLINGGNPDLRPETAWRLEFGGDLSLPGGGALGFALTRHWISDAADLVEIIAPGANPGDPDIRFDAPGNIGSGDAMSLHTNLTLPLTAVLPGARLTFDGTFWQTSVTDPVTHRQRSISGRADAEFSGEFRQDFSARHFAWGIQYEKVTEQQTLRHNELDTSEEGPYIDLFVETTAIHGLKIRAVAANVANPRIRRERRFYEPDRNFALSAAQNRERRFDNAPWLVVSVSGTF